MIKDEVGRKRPARAIVESEESALIIDLLVDCHRRNAVLRSDVDSLEYRKWQHVSIDRASFLQRDLKHPPPVVGPNVFKLGIPQRRLPHAYRITIIANRFHLPIALPEPLPRVNDQSGEHAGSLPWGLVHKLLNPGWSRNESIKRRRNKDRESADLATSHILRQNIVTFRNKE